MKYISFMKDAYKMAKTAFEKGEVPVGAVIVKDNKIIAKAHNRTENKNCAIYHAEIVAIEKACKKLNNKYLADCDLYVTLEPCPMCAGAIINSKIKRVYIGALDEKGGACMSKTNLFAPGLFNHLPEVYYGFMEDECKEIMKDFFKKKR